MKTQLPCVKCEPDITLGAGVPGFPQCAQSFRLSDRGNRSPSTCCPQPPPPGQSQG